MMMNKWAIKTPRGIIDCGTISETKTTAWEKGIALHKPLSELDDKMGVEFTGYPGWAKLFANEAVFTRYSCVPVTVTEVTP